MIKLVHAIAGTINISDDVIVYEKTKQDHGKDLYVICQRFKQIGLTLNERKCLFNHTKLTFFGMVFSAEVISPDPAKVFAIKDISAPQNVKDVHVAF